MSATVEAAARPARSSRPAAVLVIAALLVVLALAAMIALTVGAAGIPFARLPAALGISANQYSKTVTFLQKVKMKANAKTKLTGTVEYQTCDDKKCLPPKTVPISIEIK